MGKVFKDIPISEITLRRFERPYNENFDSLLRKFCISIGLLQPGDSRDIITDILKLLIEASRERKILTSKEIEHKLKNLNKEGISGSNIRRQLLRLENVCLIEKSEKGYRLREFMKVSEILNSYINKFVINPIMERINEYANEIDKHI